MAYKVKGGKSMERNISERIKDMNNRILSYGSAMTRPSDCYAGNLAVDCNRLRVASYCRVSTEEELQVNSLDNQIVHYTNYIRTNPEWQFAGVFSDLGKSGTKMESRNGFNKMIRYAKAGKIDLILCKSISRFARNVLDTLKVIRELGDKNIYILFEKENLYTGDIQSEFILTMLAATAQEESRSTSENITWATSKRFEQGEARFVRILGYKKVKGKRWVIDQKEAAAVREIFRQYLEGRTPTEIANHFIRNGYVKANGRNDWTNIAITSILRNEKYVGDALCQKTYTEDYLTHKIVLNEGQKNKYYIKDHHEGIVDRETFNKVQNMLKPKTKGVKRGPAKRYDFTGRIVCGECGANFHRYKGRGQVTWRCSSHMKSARLCKMDGIKDEMIRKALKKAFIEKHVIDPKSPAKRQIIRLEKNLLNTEVLRDGQQNRLRLDLEKALFAESMAVIENKDVTEMERERIAIEKTISEREPWWAMVDSDDQYRKDAIAELNKMKQSTNPINGLYKKLDSTKFLRAWMTRIVTKSSFLFTILWANGEETEVEIDEGGDL
ncbi:MAG TPA: recombinase family protein [Anaerovoracaceae bacterium]|nr:recombinase family protein [Anaerovoracaceae bacterium]